MPALCQTTPQNITLDLKSIYKDSEQVESATVKESLQVQQDGPRRVSRNRAFYNLQAIMAVGYRVQSPGDVQFRRRATERLNEYFVKSFTMDNDRFKQGRNIGSDYFDEMLGASATFVPAKNVFTRRSMIFTP